MDAKELNDQIAVLEFIICVYISDLFRDSGGIAFGEFS